MSRSVTIEVSALAVAAFLGVAGTIADGLEPVLRLALCLPLVVFAPGYALVRAAAPRAPLSSLTRLVLGLGTSMVIAALSGLLLQATQIGLTAASWAALLFSLTMASAVILAWRSRHLPDSSLRADPKVHALARSIGGRQGRLNVLLFAAAFAIVVAAFGIAIDAYHDQPRPGFTQLWIQPGPVPSVVTLGIRNEEGRPIDVAVDLTRDGHVEAAWSSIKLEDGETWVREAPVPNFEEGDSPLEATLTRSDSPDAVYRYVTLWPSASQPASNQP